jgi:beta-phosphoglucomutase
MHSVGIGSPEILKKADKIIPGFKNISIDILNF